MAIENENDAYLTKFPGIGKKTARQIVLDLKGKVQITPLGRVMLL
jgi:Holliday junction DNA helicase RuvA